MAARKPTLTIEKTNNVVDIKTKTPKAIVTTPLYQSIKAMTEIRDREEFGVSEVRSNTELDLGRAHTYQHLKCKDTGKSVTGYCNCHTGKKIAKQHEEDRLKASLEAKVRAF